MAADSQISPDVPRKKRRLWIWFVTGGALICLLVVGAGLLYLWLGARSVSSDAWTPENATRGMQLNLTELGRQPTTKGTEVSYRIGTVGMPTDRTYTWLIKSFQDEEPTSWGDHRVGASGQLLVAASGESAGTFTVSGFARGQPLNVALMTADGSIKVFARAIPFPIEATNGQGCRLAVEMASADGKGFRILGEGFEPNESLTSYDRSEDEMMTVPQTADANGGISILSFPAVIGKESGNASMRLVGNKCDLTVEYRWGPAALEVQ